MIPLLAVLSASPAPAPQRLAVAVQAQVEIVRAERVENGVAAIPAAAALHRQVRLVRGGRVLIEFT